MSTDAVTTLAEGKFIRLVRRDRWEYAERVKASGIVGIVAMTDDGKLLLVEQLRPTIGKSTIELPAGIAGDDAAFEGEALETAARRELLEETGYEARKLTRLTEGPPSAGISTEVITFFLATGLRKVSAGGGDEAENITVHLVPLNRIEPWLRKKEKQGCAIDLKLWGGLYFAGKAMAKRGGGKKKPAAGRRR